MRDPWSLLKLAAIPLAVASLGASPLPLQDDCIIPYSYQTHWVNGTAGELVRSYASFYGNESVCTYRVETYVHGVTMPNKTCEAGEMDESFGSCVDEVEYDGGVFGSSNVFATQDTVDVQPYGIWGGTGRFWTIHQNGSWVDNGSSTRTVNLGPSPQEECEANWGYWNEDTGQCENITDPGTPIIVPMGPGQAYRMTSIADGVWFDLDADGVLERVAWTNPQQEQAFLAVDRNGDGEINDGSELFGDHTVPGVGNGFLALAQLLPQSVQGDPSAIEFTDQLYSQLLLWTDSNHDGRSQAQELQSARDRFTRFGLGYVTHRRRDGHGNLYRYRGWAELRTGTGPNRPDSASEHQARVIKIYDILLGRGLEK